MISSLVVVANDSFADELKKVKNASIEQVLDGKYIVLLECDDFDNTLKCFNEIKALKCVSDVNMAFSECEEFDMQANAQRIADKVNALSDDANNIEYYGNIFKKY